MKMFQLNELVDKVNKMHESDRGEITIHINFNIYDSEIHIEQRAEGGSQFNKGVGMKEN